MINKLKTIYESILNKLGLNKMTRNQKNVCKYIIGVIGLACGGNACVAAERETFTWVDGVLLGVGIVIAIWYAYHVFTDE